MNKSLYPTKPQIYQSPLINKIHDDRFVSNKNILVKNPKEIFFPAFRKSDVFQVVGPTKKIAFDPKETNVAILSSGGMCPGTNTAIFELVNCLVNAYRVNHVYGVCDGFQGFYDKNTLELRTEYMEEFQDNGGCYLGTSRSPLNINAARRYLRKHNVSQLYVIGGKEAHKEAHRLAQQTDVSVGCIPKTVSNDIPFIDMSFGFQTAVDKASEMIRQIHTELRDSTRAVGIVKVMGRDCGGLALYASMVRSYVDVCLIPEYRMDYQKVLQYIHDTVTKKGRCLIVVAEGVGLGASCNPEKHLRHDLSNSYKVNSIDLTHTIKGMPANSADMIYCRSLAQSAVHVTMSGYTDFTVGEVDRTMTALPLEEIVEHTKHVGHIDDMWGRFILSNSQPNFDIEGFQKDLQ